uniref:GINS complex subunit 4 n=1 Tax=Rattus norvegicus TaxID=10116 RepID=A0ABK0L881_RAT
LRRICQVDDENLLLYSPLASAPTLINTTKRTPAELGIVSHASSPPVCLCVQVLCLHVWGPGNAQYLQSPEEGIGSLELKIEKFFPHILEKEKTRPAGEPSSLSPEEFVFAKEYMDHTETHFKNVALKHMPPNLQKVDLMRAVPKPDLDSYVFLRVKERQENILVEPEADEQRDYVIDLEEGSQHLIRYKTIAPLVASGAVQLI